MAELTEAEVILSNARDPIVMYVGGVPFLMVPYGWTAKNQEETLDKPLSIKQTPVFTKTESLFDYVKDFDVSGSRIFADDANHKVTVILDPHQKDHPEWERHKATLSYKLAPEWILWKEKSGKWMSTNEFRAFVENNLEYIVGEEFFGAQVLEMSRNLNIRFKGEIDMTTEGSGANRSLTVVDKAQGGGQLGDKRDVAFPESLTIELRVFRNCEKFQFKPRLRVMIKSGEMRFSIDLIDSSIIEDSAFDHEMKIVSEHFEGKDILFGSSS